MSGCVGCGRALRLAPFRLQTCDTPACPGNLAGRIAGDVKPGAAPPEHADARRDARAQGRAEGWDEGFRAGVRPDQHAAHNPYRAALSSDAAPRTDGDTR